MSAVKNFLNAFADAARAAAELNRTETEKRRAARSVLTVENLKHLLTEMPERGYNHDVKIVFADCTVSVRKEKIVDTADVSYDPAMWNGSRNA